MTSMTRLEKLMMCIGRKLRIPGIARLIHYVFPKGKASKRYVEGIRMRTDGQKQYLDTREHIDWVAHFRGEYEPHLGILFRRILDAGDTVIDVGANVGVHTLTFHRCVGASGTVIAIEPNPTVFAKLKKNLEVNGLPVGSALQIALGNERERLRLRVPRIESKEGENSGLASFYALDSAHDEIEVQVERFDNLISDLDIGNIRLIKIDVQGFEEKVLAGMTCSIDQFKPAIIFEYEKWAWDISGSSIENVITMLENIGYIFFCICKQDGKLERIESAVMQLEDKKHIELLAVHPSDSIITEDH